MPDIRPFRGLSYDAQRAGDLALLVAEPYDKVTDAMRAAYLAAAPNNIVKVDLPRDGEGAPAAEDRYATAGKTFRDWIAQGIVKQAEKPALYLYEQSYELPGMGRKTRRAFIGLVEAKPHSKGGVLPHERTFQEPKADRMALLEAARAHFGMCFLLYEGKGAVIAGLTTAAGNAAPIAELRLPDGTAHRITPVTDEAAIAAARKALAPLTCTIADGHHRYETQVAFRRDHEKKGDMKPAYGYRLAAFVDIADPGLTILPTHRLLPPDISTSRFDQASHAYLEPVSPGPESRYLVHGAQGGPSGYRPSPGLDLAKALPDVPEPVRKLDVTILHKLLIERALGIEAGAKEHALGYVRWVEDGLKKLRAGEFGCLVELKPTKVEDVLAVAESGAVMPQKSTDFYPKLLTGLVMNDIEDQLHGG